MITYPAITVDEIIAEREQKEKQRLEQKEKDFWEEVRKHINTKAEIKTGLTQSDINELAKDEPNLTCQILTKFSDIKIGFKRG